MEKPAITLSEAVSWAGSQSELARRLGVTAQAVSQWDQIPDGRLWQLHAIWKAERESQAKACGARGSRREPSQVKPGQASK